MENSPPWRSDPIVSWEWQPLVVPTHTDPLAGPQDRSASRSWKEGFVKELELKERRGKRGRGHGVKVTPGLFIKEASPLILMLIASRGYGISQTQLLWGRCQFFSSAHTPWAPTGCQALGSVLVGWRWINVHERVLPTYSQEHTLMQKELG